MTNWTGHTPIPELWKIGIPSEFNNSEMLFWFQRIPPGLQCFLYSSPSIMSRRLEDFPLWRCWSWILLHMYWPNDKINIYTEMEFNIMKHFLIVIAEAFKQTYTQFQITMKCLQKLLPWVYSPICLKVSRHLKDVHAFRTNSSNTSISNWNSSPPAIYLPLVSSW